MFESLARLSHWSDGPILLRTNGLSGDCEGIKGEEREH